MPRCQNKYTTLLDLARQSKIISGNTACFDGKIAAGIPFSGYPTGVNLSTVINLGIISQEDAVFSGNTGTTVFDVSNSASTNYNPIFEPYSGSTWSNPLFSGNTSGLNLPITTLSAQTQTVGPFWTLTQTGMTGDNIIGISYTGYSIQYSFFNVVDTSITGSTTYSGFTTAQEIMYSAGTLDYKGPVDYLQSREDATVDNRLITKKLRVTGGASASTIGYVLTQVDDIGSAEWVFNSASASTNTFVTSGLLNGSDHLELTYNTGGSVPPIDLSSLRFSGNTSGDCITDLYVSNIHSCSPLNINPLDEGNIYFGSDSGVTIDLGSDKKVGIGTVTPIEKLNVEGGNILSLHDQDNTSFVAIKNFNTGVDARASLHAVVRGEDGIDSSGLFAMFGSGYTGTAGFSGQYLPNSLSIATAGGGDAQRAHVNIGTRRTDGEIRFFSGDENYDNGSLLGIWNSDGLTLSGASHTFNLNTNTIQVRDSAVTGYVLTAIDSDGNAEWQESTGGGTFTGNTSGDCINELWVSNISGCTGQDLHIGVQPEQNIYFDSTGTTSEPSLFINSKSQIGIGTDTPFSWRPENGPGIEIHNPGISNQIPLAFTEGGTRRFWFETDFAAPGSIDPVNIYGGPSPSTPLMTFYTRTSPRIGMGTSDPEGNLHISRPGTYTNQTKYPDETNIVINNTSVGYTGSSGTINKSAFRFDHLGSEKPGALISSNRIPAWDSGVYSTTLEIWNASGETLFKRIEIEPEWNTNIFGDVNINYGGTFYTDLDASIGPSVRLSGNSADLITLGVADVGIQGLSIGTRGDSEPSYPGYGKQGDGFLYSSAEQNGLNIISQDGTNKEDYIRFYSGKDANGGTSDIHIQGSGTTKGNVGINTETPTEKLHVEGSVRIVDGNEQNGYVLTSDANGVGSWQPSPGGGGTFTGNTSGDCITDLWVSNISGCSLVTIGTELIVNGDTSINSHLTVTSSGTNTSDTVFLVKDSVGNHIIEGLDTGLVHIGDLINSANPNNPTLLIGAGKAPNDRGSLAFTSSGIGIGGDNDAIGDYLHFKLPTSTGSRWRFDTTSQFGYTLISRQNNSFGSGAGLRNSFYTSRSYGIDFLLGYDNGIAVADTVGYRFNTKDSLLAGANDVERFIIGSGVGDTKSYFTNLSVLGVGTSNPDTNVTLHISGDTLINGSLTADTLTLFNTPTINNSGTEILVRNSTNGEVEYRDVSTMGSFTGNTSGDCISDLWVSNIHSCSPLNINPGDEGNVYYGSTSGVTIDVINSHLGIGTDNPSFPLHIVSTNQVEVKIESSTNNAFLTLSSSDSTNSFIDYEKSSGDRWIVGTHGSDSDKFKWASGSTFGSDTVMTLTKNAQLGIGTQSPEANLHIKGLTPPLNDNIFLLEDSSGNIVMGANDEGALAIGVDPHDIAMSGESSLFIKGDSSTSTGSFDDSNIALRAVNSLNYNILVVKNGNAGTAGSNKGRVCVNGNFGTQLLVNDDAVFSVYGDTSSSASALGSVMTLSDGQTNGLHTFYNNGAVSLAYGTIQYSKIGIGTTTAASIDSKLHVKVGETWKNVTGYDYTLRIDGLQEIAPYTATTSDIFTVDNFGNVDVKKRTTTSAFTMTNGAVDGYVLTSDGGGNATWGPVSGSSSTFTGNTSGTCIDVLWVSTISGCSPVTIGSSIQSQGSTASGIGSIAYGEENVASGEYSQAFGKTTIATGSTAHAQGEDTMAYGQDSHAEGKGTMASGDQSHAEGNLTIASADSSHAEGNLTIASAEYSHAEGDASTASGDISHAEGTNTTASGTASHTEGGFWGEGGALGTTASGLSSHAEGCSTDASGDGSHAEGYSTTASGIQSHAEGGGTTASAASSHAEGDSTVASGIRSHAQGYETQASGLQSHAAGSRTIANGTSSFASGYGGGLGYELVASGYTSFVHYRKSLGSGSPIGVWSDYSTILGGSDHDLGEHNDNSIILGGDTNKILDPGAGTGGNHSILGGSGHRMNVESSDENNTIIGGINNDIGTLLGAVRISNSSIIGGENNSLEGELHDGAIIGGNNNTLNDGVDRSVIIGGSNITAISADTVYMPNVDLCTFGGALYSNTIIPCSPLTISPGNEGNVHIGDQGGAPIITLDILTPDEPGIYFGEESFIRWKENEQKLIIGEEEAGGKVVIEVEGAEILDVEKEKTVVREGDFETEDGNIIVKSGNSKTVIIEDIPDVSGANLGTNIDGEIIDVPSDSRVKWNIEEIPNVVDPLEFINNVKGYQFQWRPETRIGDPNKLHYGFKVDDFRDDLINTGGQSLSQNQKDVNTIAKSMVEKTKRKFMFGNNSQPEHVDKMNYEDLIPFMIEGIKSLNVNMTNLSSVSSGGAKKYVQIHTLTKGNTETIVHNLNEADVIVQLLSETGEMVIPDRVSTYLPNSVDIDISVTSNYKIIIMG